MSREPSMSSSAIDIFGVGSGDAVFGGVNLCVQILLLRGGLHVDLS